MATEQATEVPRKCGRPPTGRPSDKVLPVEQTPEDEKDGIDDGFIDPDGTISTELLEDDKTEYCLNPTLGKKPADVAGYRHTITFTRFTKIHDETMLHQRVFKEKSGRWLSMPDLIRHIAKKYIGRDLGVGTVDALWEKHREWQRNYTEVTGKVEVPPADMTRKLFELFSIGVGPKLD